ncbi:MAG: DNA repair protein RadA [Bacteroidales bacterium]
MAKKAKTVYVCQQCGYDSPKWMGKCPACGEWNTLVEHKIATNQKAPSTLQQELQKQQKPQPVGAIQTSEYQRISTGIEEFDRVLGGGLVPGSVVLIGGEPGIGKSTLALQMALGIKNRVLYISGEESAEQIKFRADRIGLQDSPCHILGETSAEKILEQTNDFKPELLVVDSVQTIFSEALESAAGTVSQIRESTALLLQYAKQTAIPLLLIGHINKEGSIAGPKILEHMVDVVLQFEGDRQFFYRILRSAKNRFGPTSEIGIFEMVSAGLKEIPNPSEILASQSGETLSGMAVASALNGSRPMLIELEALVSTAVYGTPQRTTSGFDTRKLGMLLAVLEKRAGFHLAHKDVFLNIAGGIKIDDPALDLAVLAAILSSNMDHAIGKSACFAAEVGLTGEIRPVPRIQQRIVEAQKLGFKKIYISSYNRKNLESEYDIQIIPVSNVADLVKSLFR